MIRATVRPLAVVLLFVARPTMADAQRSSTPTTLVAVSPGLFEFHSGMWLNLHSFLYVRARARRGFDSDRQAVTISIGDTVGFDRRPEAERRGWERALDYYATTLADKNAVFDSLMVSIKNRLAELENAPSLRGSGLDPRLIEALDEATPVYRALWWPRHDAANRAWIASMLPLLAQHGRTIATGVTRAYDATWPAEPIRVDVSAYTNWSGAYTTVAPSHIMASSQADGIKGTLGLELLFHESSHTLDDSLDATRRATATTSGKRVSPDLTHAIIFYTAGEVTRRTVPGHVPYAVAEGLWRRSASMGRFLPFLERHWSVRIDGRTTMQEAMRAIIGEL